MSKKTIYTASDKVEVSRIIATLQEEGVNVFHTPSAASGIFGTNWQLDITVDEADEERALEIIRDLRS